MRVGLLPVLSSLLWLSTAPAALADVTAQDAWDRWQNVLTQLGGTLNADQPTVDGSALTVRGINVLQDTNDGATRTTLIYPETTFLPNGDGTVSVTLGDDIQVIFADAPPFQPPYQITGRIELDDLLITASGQPQDMRFDYAGRQMTLILDEILSGEDSADLAMTMTVQSPMGANTVTRAQMVTSTQSFSADALSLSMDVPDTGAQFEVALDDISGQSTAVLPTLSDPAITDIFAQDGASLQATYDYDRAAMTFAQTQGGEFYSGTVTSGASLFSTVLRDKTASYEGQSTDLDINISGPLPAPIVAQMDSYKYSVTAPSAPTDTPRDLAIQMTLGGLTVGEALWAQYDPNATLPRDPATIELDLTGQAKLPQDTDPTDPFGAIMGLNGLQNLQLNRLFVDIIGAQLSGAGTLQFPASQAASFMGIPQPVGDIDLTLLGGTAALDKLTALGLVPAEQAFGAKMMIGLFATQGPGEDELSTQIRLGADGSISVNGQRIR